MLPSQVGAIDRNRPGNRDIASREEEIPVTHSHLRRVLSLWLVSVLMCVVIAAPQVSGQSKGRKRKAGTSATAGGSPGEQSLTNIPLPIGHEAKGLVLPDFDGDGRLRGKFEAGTAHRIDQEHVGFQHLKITTYTPQRHRARLCLPRKLRNQRKTKRKTRIKRKKINHPARTYLARAPRGSNPINRRQRKSIRTRLFLIQPRTWASLAAV